MYKQDINQGETVSEYVHNVNNYHYQANCTNLYNRCTTYPQTIYNDFTD